MAGAQATACRASTTSSRRHECPELLPTSLVDQPHKALAATSAGFQDGSRRTRRTKPLPARAAETASAAGPSVRTTGNPAASRDAKRGRT